jgi:hypothetical protein
MKSVFVLQHVHTLPGGEEDIKFVGVYSSEALALKAVARVSIQPGFRDDPGVVDPDGVEIDGFHIGKYVIDVDHWTEGFVTV